VPGRRNHFDTGAVARCLKQRKAQRILLSTKYSAYQSFLVFSNPIAAAILAHFEVVQREHGCGRKAGHIRSANLLFPSLSRAANTIGKPSLDCERPSISHALTSHKTRELHQLGALDASDQHGFHRYLATEFQPDKAALRGTAGAAATLAQAADPPRQELLRLG
jgi:hypothetical protein